MTPLHGAVALVEMDDVAVAVAQDLHFDVAGAAHVALQEHGVVSEGGAGLEPRLFQQAREIGGTLDHAHTAAAAAERSLDDQREADPVRDLRRFRGVRDGRSVPGTTGMPVRMASWRAAVLSPSSSSSSAFGTDESDACGGAGAGQRWILGQKAVARMDGVDTLFRRQGHDTLDVEIGLHRPLALATR